MTLAVLPFGAMRQSRAISIAAGDGVGVWGWNETGYGALATGNRAPVVINGVHISFCAFSYGTSPDFLTIGLKPYPFADSRVATSLAAQFFESLEISGAASANGKYLRTSAAVSVEGVSPNRYVSVQWTLTNGTAPSSGNFTATIR